MKEFIKNLKFAWKYCKYQKKELIKYIILSIFNIIIGVITPLLSAKIIVNLTNNGFEQLMLISFALFIIQSIKDLMNYKSNKYSQILYRESIIRLQTDLIEEVLKLKNETLDTNGTGVFIQRLNSDVDKIADIFNILCMDLTGILTNIGIFVAIFIINKILFIYILLSSLLLFCLQRLRTSKYTLNDKIYRKERERISSFVGEIIRGVRDIKMLDSEISFVKELYNKSYTLNQKRYKMQELNSKYRLLINITYELNDLLLVVLLVFLIIKNNLSVASALIIMNYSGRVESIAYKIGFLLESVKDFNLSTSRVFEIINGEKYLKEKFGKKHIKKVKGNFEFKNICFGYDKKMILKDLSFSVKANETVAFVGKSGAGKTTIFNLLCKMYDVTKGEILIDGININELDKKTIRGNITIISQNPYIFNLSIKDNLKIVKRNVTMKEIEKACKLACLDTFINGLPEKYDTLIGEGGVNLSGGQKQRLAIARAFIQNTEIILFDEATSALDNETQKSIQKAINNMKSKYTIMIIAHRLSTIISADKIFFINNGKIIAQGTHKELLNDCKEYRKLYENELINRK